MESKFIGFNDKINRVVKTPIDQGRIVAMAIALAVSSQAMLPSSAVENPLDYFATSVAPAAKQIISECGEGIVFSAKTALEYTSRFWKMRYNAAHPATALDAAWYFLSNPGGNTDSFDFNMMWSGGLTVLSQEDVTFLNKYRAEIMQLACTVAPLLKTTSDVGGCDAIC